MKKKLNNWALEKSLPLEIDRGLASAIVCFCLTTAPLDPFLREKAVKHMRDDVLATEFRRYKAALNPHGAMTGRILTMKTLLADMIFGGGSESMDTLRLFKVFVVNCLKELSRDPNFLKKVNFSMLEAACFERSVKMWFDCVLASA